MSKTSMTATHPQMRPDQAMSMIEALYQSNGTRPYAY